MTTATYHSDRGENSALLLIREHPFAYERTPVYVPRAAVTGKTIGEEIAIPAGFEIVDFVDHETGEVRTTKEGQNFKVLRAKA